MTPAEVARMLAKAAAYDRRTVTEIDVAAWHEIVARVDLLDALAAVTRHYTETRDWMMPADFLKHARAAKEERRRRELGNRAAPPMALPSRFEPDMVRDVQIQRGIAQCRDAIAPVMEALRQHRVRSAREGT